MRLLVVTQKVDRNDPVLGFFHRWLEEFAKNVENLSVICLQEGEHSLPKNVQIYSLGKERGALRLKYVLNFYRLLWQLRGSYDSVFVHMNQVYVLLGGIFWRIKRIPVGFWYAHRAKGLSLKIAEKFANVIFTNTQMSFRTDSKKVVLMGHGIDTKAASRPQDHKVERKQNSILCVGRLTPIKDQETIVRACEIVSSAYPQTRCTFVGGPATSDDQIYIKHLEDIISRSPAKNIFKFTGEMKQDKLFPQYWESGVHINACPTGGMDKVVIEAAVGGAIPVVSNKSFETFLVPYGDRLIFPAGDFKALAKLIEELFASSDREEMRSSLRDKAVNNFDVGILITKIMNWYETSK